MRSNNQHRFPCCSSVIKYRKLPFLSQKLWRNMHMSDRESPQFWRSSSRCKKYNNVERLVKIDSESVDGDEHRDLERTFQHTDSSSPEIARHVTLVKDREIVSNFAGGSLEEYGGEISDDDHDTSSMDYVLYPTTHCERLEINTSQNVSISNRAYNIYARRPLYNDSSGETDHDDQDSPGKSNQNNCAISMSTRVGPRQKAAPYQRDKITPIECEDDSVQFVRRRNSPRTPESKVSSPSSSQRIVKVQESTPAGKYRHQPLFSTHRKKISSLMACDGKARQNEIPTSSLIRYDKDYSSVSDSSTKCQNNHRHEDQSQTEYSLKHKDNHKQYNTVENNNIEDTDDDIIVVQSDQAEEQDIDHATFKRVVISVVTHYIDENPNTEITMQYVLQRLKALYHKDFSERLPEIKCSIRRAMERCKSVNLQKLRRVVRPGVRHSDIVTLSSENWVNDIIINQYMAILVKDKLNYGAISSFWYEELLRGKETSLPDEWENLKCILAPTCVDSHWSLLCYMPVNHTVEIYTSMSICESDVQCSQMLLDFFDKKSKAKIEGQRCTVSGLPRQQNEHDCGVYICMFARCIVCGNSFTIMPQQVCEFRRWLKNEIVQEKLFGAKEEISEEVLDSESDIDTRCETEIEYLD